MVTLSGCATQNATLQANAPTALDAQGAHTQTHQFFVGGIGQTKTVDAAAICGGAHKVASVQSTLTTKDALLGFVTLGIYTPHTATVFCK